MTDNTMRVQQGKVLTLEGAVETRNVHRQQHMDHRPVSPQRASAEFQTALVSEQLNTSHTKISKAK